MRRHPIRFVLALVATSSLVACADLATAPQAPKGPRFDSGAVDTTVLDTVKKASTSHQGSNI